MRFEVGKTYQTRSICDHDCIFAYTILARTEKSVTIKVNGQRVRRGLKMYDGAEYFMPLGSYSMAPIVRAA